MFAFITSLFALITVRKVGGLYHWRVGRIGGSFYLAKAKARKARPAPRRRLPAFGLTSYVYTPRPAPAPVVRAERIAFALAMH